jgi:hypothetical protein
MAYPMTLPILVGLAVVGTATGVHLGRSAIAEIDPAYFSEPEVPFHADLVPYRSPDWAQVQAAEYERAGSLEGLGSGCVGCRDYPEEYYPRPDPAVDGYADGQAASIAYEPAQTILVEAAPDPGRERVERYAHYPVSAEEEEAPADVAPAEEAYAATQ